MEFFTKHAHWAGVNSVCLALTSNGYVAWLAGGCVRDWLMQREPQDFDVATSATPDQVGELFANAIEVGKSFGVMIVPFGGYQVEIATFRADGPYHDGRRPEKIAFAEPKADAERRDFTCNSNRNVGSAYVSGDHFRFYGG